MARTKAMRKTRKPRAKRSRGYVRTERLQARMTRAQIARTSSMDRMTVSKYLTIEGAPQPDKHNKYDRSEVLAWISRNSTTAHGSSELREAKLTSEKLRAEEAAFDLGVKKGRYIERTEIIPAVSAFNGQLTVDLQSKFELELPAKYAGRTRQECAELNATAVDWVLNRLKAGQRPIIGKESAA